MSEFDSAINAYSPKVLTRATIADGTMLDYWCFQPLANRDIVVSNYLTELSGNAVHNSNDNKLYFYTNNSYTDTTASKLSLTNLNVANANIKTKLTNKTKATVTNLQTDDLTINSTFKLVDGFTSKTDVRSFASIIATILQQYADTMQIMKDNEKYWNTLQFIEVHKATGPTDPGVWLDGPVITIAAGDNITIEENLATKNVAKLTINAVFDDTIDVYDHTVDLTTL